MNNTDPVLQRIKTQLELVNISVQIQSSLVSSIKMRRDALSAKILDLMEQIRKQKQEIQHILLYAEKQKTESMNELKSRLEDLYEEKKRHHSEMDMVKIEYAAAWEKLKAAWAEQNELRRKENERYAYLEANRHTENSEDE